MSKTIKFAVSMSEQLFKELEFLRRKTGWTRSQFIRDTIRSWKAEFSRPSGVKEDAEQYKKEVPKDVTNPAERRRRAKAAAGRFRSGFSDLSSNHDKHLEDTYAAIASNKDEKKSQ